MVQGSVFGPWCHGKPRKALALIAMDKEHWEWRPGSCMELTNGHTYPIAVLNHETECPGLVSRSHL